MIFLRFTTRAPALFFQEAPLFCFSFSPHTFEIRNLSAEAHETGFQSHHLNGWNIFERPPRLDGQPHQVIRVSAGAVTKDI